MPQEAPSRRFDRSLIDGPLLHAVWKLAWPTMLQNAFAGLQGMVDHALVGRFVGYTANAAIGVSWQIILVVITFIASLYTGTAVFVARAAGAGDSDRVNRVVYQAFLASLLLAGLVLAPAGYLLAPRLLDIVNAAPEVKREALPFLRIMLTCSVGMLVFFMLGGAFRAAGDAQTPLRLGIGVTILNAALNIVLIRGLGPIPALGTAGAAIGTVTANAIVGGVGLLWLFSGRSVIRWSRGMSWRIEWPVIRSLFAIGLPAGFQGIAMNVAGLFLLRFIGSLGHSAEAQAAYAVGYGELFSLVTWTSVGLMGAASTVVGQNLGANRPERSEQGPAIAARIGLCVAAVVGLAFVLFPRALFGLFGLTDPTVLDLGSQLLRFLSVSGLFVTVALTYTGALQGSGDTRSPFVISIISQIVVPLGLCSALEATGHLAPAGVWTAIVLGHITRATLSVARFKQGKWRSIRVKLGHNRDIPLPAAPQAATLLSSSISKAGVRSDRVRRPAIATGQRVPEEDGTMRIVRDLLNAKGREVHSISPEASVYDALTLMADRNIGAVLVVDRQGTMVGILSERDYARKVVLRGHASRDTPVSAIMTEEVVCIPPEMTIDECMGLMTMRRIRHLPVTEHQRPIGVVSIGDVGRAMIENQGFVIEQLERYISGAR